MRCFLRGEYPKKGASTRGDNYNYLQYSCKYMKVINRLTSDPPPEKKKGVAPLPLSIRIPPPLTGLTGTERDK